jgi:hypothetical protein
MRKYAKVVPITAGRLNSQEPHKEMIVPIPTGSSVQLSLSELLLRYLQKTQETAQAETNRPKRRKVIYLPTRRSDDSCNR